MRLGGKFIANSDHDVVEKRAQFTVAFDDFGFATVKLFGTEFNVSPQLLVLLMKIGTLNTILAGPEGWVKDSQPFVAV